MSGIGQVGLSRATSLAVLAVISGCASREVARSGSSNDDVPPTATSARQAASAVPPGATLLHFDWGDGFEASVHAVRDEVSIQGSSRRTSTLDARFRLHAERDGNGYALTWSDLVMTLDGAPVPEAAHPDMIGPVTGMVLSLNVAMNGDFIGMHDFDRLQTFTQRTYLAQNASRPPRERASPEEAERAMESGSSREVLQLETSRTWGALVGMWTGLAMTEGAPLTSHSTVTIPIIDSPVTFHSTFHLIGHEPCSKGGRGHACVRLKASSRPDTQQIASAIEKLRERAGTGDFSSTPGGMQVEDHYELLTDPDTMKPQWAQWTRSAALPGNSTRPENQGIQSTRTQMTFDYSG